MRYAAAVDVDAVVAKYRQAWAAARIEPLPDDVAADRLRELLAAFAALAPPGNTADRRDPAAGSALH